MTNVNQRNYTVVNSGSSVWFTVNGRSFTIARNEPGSNTAYLEFMAEQLREALEEIAEGESRKNTQA